MQQADLIVVTEFYTNNNIEISFFESLMHHGLIDVVTVDGKDFICADQLQFLEKLVREHFYLAIYIKEIEANSHLLQRITTMHHQIDSLQCRLD